MGTALHGQFVRSILDIVLSAYYYELPNKVQCKKFGFGAKGQCNALAKHSLDKAEQIHDRHRGLNTQASSTPLAEIPGSRLKTGATDRSMVRMSKTAKLNS